MNRLFTNAAMSFLSMYGRNLGKLAFGKSHICGVVIGKSNILHAPAVDITFWCCYFPITLAFFAYYLMPYSRLRF